ncbi:hypothetical protein OU995_10460 [Roseateles sp. SL47]|nr:hypothetical protein [Roseateles sp. SL47]WAC75086.1 hypothetical protein OU995_10460 [Roseateles sp. SL47]
MPGLGTRTSPSTRPLDGSMVEVAVGVAAQDWTDQEALTRWRQAVAAARR